MKHLNSAHSEGTAALTLFSLRRFTDDCISFCIVYKANDINSKEAAWLVGCTACFYGVSRDRTFELGKMGKQIGLLSSHITVTAARSNPYLSPPLDSCWLKCLMGNSFHPHDV